MCHVKLSDLKVIFIVLVLLYTNKVIVSKFSPRLVGKDMTSGLQLSSADPLRWSYSTWGKLLQTPQSCGIAQKSNPIKRDSKKSIADLSYLAKYR
jgi:hypothetical protein